METQICLLLRAFFKPIAHERPQTRKFVSRIDILLDDVKREIIKPAKTPNRDGEQQSIAPIPIFGEQRECSHGAREEEQEAFENNQIFRFEIAHKGKDRTSSEKIPEISGALRQTRVTPMNKQNSNQPLIGLDGSGALPIAPSLEVSLEALGAPQPQPLVNNRVLLMSALAIGLGVAAALIARLLVALIGLVTSLSFYGKFSTDLVSPANNKLGLWVILIPVVGGIIVGVMARYGSKAIRGHGIPEAMEQVLLNESRIPPRLTFLKPISSAIAIGTGGPFGAEGPIIATGGALGSFVGQVLHTTADERKTLLAAGAAAGMSAIFGSPVSAVLLAVELLLFEFRPRSLIPVALASVAAAAMRYAALGSAAVFAMPNLAQPSREALAFYVVLGAFMGLVSVGVTKLVYGVEDVFEKLPIHWMWWPALGGVAVGVVGYFAPHTLGVGYDNIEQILTGQLVGRALIVLCVLKFISWVIALGSGTSGGTLAPLFTVGGAMAHRSEALLRHCCRALASIRASRVWSAWRRFSRVLRARCSRRWFSRSRRRCNRSDFCRFWAVARRLIWFRRS